MTARAKKTNISDVFSGTWRLVETERWDRDELDTFQPAFIRFDDKQVGGMGLLVIQAELDCRYSERDGQPLVEFTFEGDDDGHPCSGRGWGTIRDGKLRGRIFIHLGDDSELVAERQSAVRAASKSSAPRAARRRSVK